MMYSELLGHNVFSVDLIWTPFLVVGGRRAAAFFGGKPAPDDELRVCVVVRFFLLGMGAAAARYSDLSRLDV